MQIINLIEANAISLVIIALLCYDAKRRVSKPFDIEYRLFNAIMYITALLLVVDSLGRVFDGLPGKPFYLANLLSNMLLYVLVPAAPVVWALYTLYQIEQQMQNIRKVFPFFMAVLCFNAAITLLSIRTGWYFSVDANNVYHRGPLFPLHMALAFAMPIYPYIQMFRHQKQMNRRHFYTLLLLPVPTIVGGLLQCAFYGTSLTWCCGTISVLLVYLNIQAERLGTDYLTGVFNRRLMDEYIREKVHMAKLMKTFSVILIDFDHFKKINDRFGHRAGDRALQTVTSLMKSCLRQDDFIARYGGDEFMIVLDIDDPHALKDTVTRLHEYFNQYNATHSLPYLLSFSAGYAVYSPASGMKPEQFVDYVDRLMYADKKEKECYKTVKTETA